jgi:flagellar L-ring protein precursor FlgH
MNNKILLLCILFSGCDTYTEEQASVEYEPLYLAQEEKTDNPGNFGGIYNPQIGSLFSMEGRASRVGDILTVAFSESFQATKSQNAATSKSSENSLNLPTLFDSVLPNSAKFDSGIDSSFSGSGSTAQSNSLTGSISVHVVRVFANGNLEIIGQKKLRLNNGDEYVRVRGIVRPKDISSDNVIKSERIADADIQYIGAGDIARSGKKGWYSQILDSVSPL